MEQNYWYVINTKTSCKRKYWICKWSSIKLRDYIRMTSMKSVPFSRSPTSLVHLHPKFFHALSLDVQFLTNPPLQMVTNQLEEHIIQRGLLYVIRSFLQVGFLFQYQLINLIWLSFDFFSFTWSLTICFLYSVVQKHHEISFIYKYSHFKYKLILLSTCFICTNWKCTQTMDGQLRPACQQAKSKQKKQVTSDSN